MVSRIARALYVVALAVLALGQSGCGPAQPSVASLKLAYLPSEEDTEERMEAFQLLMADLRVDQLEKDSSTEGAVLRSYTLKYCFPTNVSPIDLAYDSNDQIEEFTVEWQYSYFTAEAGTRDGVSGIGIV